jgi:hypothetical protein
MGTVVRADQESVGGSVIGFGGVDVLRSKGSASCSSKRPRPGSPWWRAGREEPGEAVADEAAGLLVEGGDEGRARTVPWAMGKPMERSRVLGEPAELGLEPLPLVRSSSTTHAWYRSSARTATILDGTVPEPVIVSRS